MSFVFKIHNVRQFFFDLNGAKKYFIRLAVEWPKEYAEIFFRILLKRTPSKSGRARGNWVISMNTPNRNVPYNPPKGTIDSGQAEGFALKQLNMLQGYKTGQTIWVANSVPYIFRLENGWSQQAPQGMVALTINELGMMKTA